MKSVRQQPNSPGRFTKKNSKGQSTADLGSRKSYKDQTNANDFEAGKNAAYDQDYNDQASRFKNEKTNNAKGDYNTDKGKKGRISHG